MINLRSCPDICLIPSGSFSYLPGSNLFSEVRLQLLSFLLLLLQPLQSCLEFLLLRKESHHSQAIDFPNITEEDKWRRNEPDFQREYALQKLRTAIRLYYLEEDLRWGRCSIRLKRLKSSSSHLEKTGCLRRNLILQQGNSLHFNPPGVLVTSPVQGVKEASLGHQSLCIGTRYMDVYF